MKTTVPLHVAAFVCVLLNFPLLARAVPADALAAGKLMAFSHAADAIETQCQGEAPGVLAAWRKRNHESFEIVRAYGRRVKWYPANAADPSRWESLQRQERQAVAARMVEVLATDREEKCHRLIVEYQSGKFDLRNYPEDLRAVEAYGR